MEEVGVGPEVSNENCKGVGRQPNEERLRKLAVFSLEKKGDQEGCDGCLQL